MNDVRIQIYEDSPIEQAADFQRLSSVPRSETGAGTTYNFHWHSDYHARDDAVRITSKERFEAAAKHLSEIREPAILFFDLQMLENNRPVSFSPSLISDPVLGWIRMLSRDPSIDRDAAVIWIKDNKNGLLLALIAAANANWHGGVITFATQRTDIDEKVVDRITDTKGRIVWCNALGSLSAGNTATVRALKVADAIDAFLAPLRGPEIWSQLSTKGWFDNTHNDNRTAPQHDPRPDVSTQVALIRGYIERLLKRKELPTEWFATGQYEVLFEALKGHVGCDSACEGNASKNLRLGAVPLLIAAWMNYEGVSIEWFMSYRWQASDASNFEIMKHSDPQSAKRAVLALARWVAMIGASSQKVPQVSRMHWGAVSGDTSPHLFIDLVIDPLDRGDKDRSLLQGVFGLPWGIRKGKLLNAYKDLIDAATAGDAALKLSLCIYPIQVQPQEANALSVMTRLDLRSVK